MFAATTADLLFSKDHKSVDIRLRKARKSNFRVSWGHNRAVWAFIKVRANYLGQFLPQNSEGKIFWPSQFARCSGCFRDSFRGWWERRKLLLLQTHVLQVHTALPYTLKSLRVTHNNHLYNQSLRVIVVLYTGVIGTLLCIPCRHSVSRESLLIHCSKHGAFCVQKTMSIRRKLFVSFSSYLRCEINRAGGKRV